MVEAVFSFSATLLYGHPTTITTPGLFNMQNKVIRAIITPNTNKLKIAYRDFAARLPNLNIGKTKLNIRAEYSIHDKNAVPQMYYNTLKEALNDIDVDRIMRDMFRVDPIWPIHNRIAVGNSESITSNNSVTLKTEEEDDDEDDDDSDSISSETEFDWVGNLNTAIRRALNTYITIKFTVINSPRNVTPIVVAPHDADLTTKASDMLDDMKRVDDMKQVFKFTQQTADTYIGVIIITPTSDQGEEETFYVIRERLAEKILPMDVNTIRSSEYQDVKKCAEFELPSKNHFETFVYIQIMANIVGGCPLKLTKPKMNMRYPGDRQRFQDYKFVDATFRSS